MNFPSDWLLELERLTVKYEHLGVPADRAGLTQAEAYALLSWLRTLGDGE